MERLAEYTEWALRIHGLVERAVAAVHARGIVFNDLHLFNIMVSEDESSVVLLDFEAAQPAAEGGRQTVANPAFVAPADRRGFDVDRYALACLRIALFIPLTSLLAVDRGKAAHLAETAAARFPVPPASWTRRFGRSRVTRPAGRSGGSSRAPDRPAGRSRFLPTEPGDWPNSRDSMVGAILASATPEREDRFFPGDIAQFATAAWGHDGRTRHRRSAPRPARERGAPMSGGGGQAPAARQTARLRHTVRLLRRARRLSRGPSNGSGIRLPRSNWRHSSPNRTTRASPRPVRRDGRHRPRPGRPGHRHR